VTGWLKVTMIPDEPDVGSVTAETIVTGFPFSVTTLGPLEAVLPRLSVAMKVMLWSPLLSGEVGLYDQLMLFVPAPLVMVTPELFWTPSRLTVMALLPVPPNVAPALVLAVPVHVGCVWDVVQEAPPKQGPVITVIVGLDGSVANPKS
jgi:hypothetical protein